MYRALEERLSVTPSQVSRVRPVVLTIAVLVVLNPATLAAAGQFQAAAGVFWCLLFQQRLDDAELRGGFQLSWEGAFGDAQLGHRRLRHHCDLGGAGPAGGLWTGAVRYGWTVPVTYVILAVRFYPKITTILPYYIMVRSLHLLFTVTAVIIAHESITLPLVVLIMITFFNEIPKGLEEAAALDGCSVWASFRHVILPLVRPALVRMQRVSTAMSVERVPDSLQRDGPEFQTSPCKSRRS